MSRDSARNWRPATAEMVAAIVRKELADCDAAQAVAFNRYCVEARPASIIRYGQIESVIVVAQRGNEVLYWEDVEEGFNISAVDDQGRIVDHQCNQDPLAVALGRWI